MSTCKHEQQIICTPVKTFQKELRPPTTTTNHHLPPLDGDKSSPMSSGLMDLSSSHETEKFKDFGGCGGVEE